MKKIIFILCLLLTLSFIGCSEKTKVTLENYNKIQSDMTYEQVKEILGDGQENASTEQKDLKIVIKSFQWVNKDGSNVQIMFENNKVDSKAQAGLK